MGLIFFCHHMRNRPWGPGRSYVMRILRDERMKRESYFVYPDGVAFTPISYVQCMKYDKSQTSIAFRN